MAFGNEWIPVTCVVSICCPGGEVVACYLFLKCWLLAVGSWLLMGKQREPNASASAL